MADPRRVDVFDDQWSDGWLESGDTAPFPAGAAGAHQIVNRTPAPIRYLIAAHHVSPEVVEYPDSGKLAAMSYGKSHRGGRLWTWHRFGDAVDFFDGEEPRA
jgi:uncharacterized cupin superfamily protein